MEDVKRRTARVRAALVAGLLLCAPLARPASDSIEYRVKAAFLLNFTKFTEWPSTAFRQPNAPLNICVVGDDPFSGQLDQLVAGELLDGRRVTVSRVKRAMGSPACQVLFFARTDRETVRALQTAGPGVLTVGEGADFLRNGGVIAFVIEENRVRFSINQASAENSGLRLSSRLLGVARSVEK